MANIKPFQREKILDTALILFTKNGYFNTSVQDIRRAGEVSIGSIYHYFDSKERIAAQLYYDLLADMEQAMERIMSESSGAQERCRKVVAHLFQQAEENPKTLQFILQGRLSDFLPDEKPICSSRPFELMRQMVEEGVRTGEVREIDRIVGAAAVFGGVLRMIQLHLDGVLPKALQEYEEECWRCAWSAIAA
ncbi:MAG: TetR/AcrR family transcriptional regulator [bacterium]|nr:TetR/AcrR family transcriptional regulator [bacterium]